MEVNILDELDIADLGEEALHVEAQPLQRIRESHHALARMIASGVSHTDAARHSGFCVSRVSVLMGDPSFRGLLQHYKDGVEIEFEATIHQLKTLSLDALQALADKLEANELPTSALLKLAEMGLDRTGHGPTSTINQNTLNLTPEDLKDIKDAARTTIEIQANSGSGERVAIEPPSAARDKVTPAVERVKGEGDNIRALVRPLPEQAVAGDKV